MTIKIKISVNILFLSILLGSTVAQDQTFRSESNVVLVPALVKDARGGAVYGLEAKDFIIEDDGVAQPVHLDQAAESAPLSVVVAIQCGRRASREFSRMRGLSSMLNPILAQPESQIALVEFDSKINLVRDFTGDERVIEKDLNNLRAGDDGAAILDTVNFSVRLLEKEPTGRQRVLLLISETRDHGSHFAKIRDVVMSVGNSNTVVYALPFSPSVSQVLDTERGSDKDEWNAAPDLLAPLLLARQAMRKNTAKAITSMTGGEYEMFASRKSFEKLMTNFTNHLHSRYLLSFEPKSPHPGLHQLNVRLREPGTTTVLYRASYWAAGNAPVINEQTAR